LKKAFPSKFPKDHSVAEPVNQKGGDAMMTITPEAEKIREIMQEQPRADLIDELPKHAGARSHTRAGEGLTCSETQVEAILSEGEST